MRAWMVIFLLALCGCEQGPKDVVADHLEAVTKGEHQKAYDLLSSKDKAIRTLAQYQAEREKLSVAGELGEAKIAGDKATVTAGTGDRQRTLHLVREKDGWRIHLDWAAHKQASEAMSEADKLAEKKDLEAAKKKYQEVAAIPSDAPEVGAQVTAAKKKIEEIDARIARLKLQAAYANNVKLENIWKNQLQIGDRAIVSYTAEVVNTGNEPLSLIEVKFVGRKDEKDTAAAFEKMTPNVLAEGNAKLGPGEKKQLKIGGMELPKDFTSGVIDLSVSRVEFAPPP